MRLFLSFKLIIATAIIVVGLSRRYDGLGSNLFSLEAFKVGNKWVIDLIIMKLFGEISLIRIFRSAFWIRNSGDVFISVMASGFFLASQINVNADQYILS